MEFIKRVCDGFVALLQHDRKVLQLVGKVLRVIGLLCDCVTQQGFTV